MLMIPTIVAMILAPTFVYKYVDVPATSAAECNDK